VHQGIIFSIKHDFADHGAPDVPLVRSVNCTNRTGNTVRLTFRCGASCHCGVRTDNEARRPKFGLFLLELIKYNSLSLIVLAALQVNSVVVIGALEHFGVYDDSQSESFCSSLPFSQLQLRIFTVSAVVTERLWLVVCLLGLLCKYLAGLKSRQRNFLQLCEQDSAFHLLQ